MMHENISDRHYQLIHNILKRLNPGIVRGRWLARAAHRNWKHYLANKRAFPTSWLVSHFREKLRQELGLTRRMHLPAAIRQRRKAYRNRDHADLELIKTLRVVLAKTGLEMLQADLVVFDEFQRFRDLLTSRGDQGVSRVAEMIIEGEVGRSPSVLLLSATPYKLYQGSWETLFGEQDDHEQLFDLYEWLRGGNDEAKRDRATLQEQFCSYATALRSPDPTGPETRRAKLEIEERLGAVMARTERFGHDLGQVCSRAIPIEAQLVPDDLRSFAHTARCFQGHPASPSPSGYATASVPYWSSVPLPMQTLGPDYKPWKAALKTRPASERIFLDSTRRNGFDGPAKWPHPKLRALQDRYPEATLALPWQAPSLPWWEIEGPWSTTTCEKLLVFSRFRAVPRSVAALLSFSLEQHLLAKRDFEYHRVPSSQPLRPTPGVLALFHPCMPLVEQIDPVACRSKRSDGVVRRARKQLEHWLRHRATPITVRSGPTRSLPHLVVALERALGTWDASKKAWEHMIHRIGRKGSGRNALISVLHDWERGSAEPMTRLSKTELDSLTRYALAGPGTVVARALRRHWPEGDQNDLLATSWEGLRNYLNYPWFDAALAGGGTYEQRIMRAVLDGNLESVLDEHLWATAVLRHSSGTALAKQLRHALSIRTSTSQLYDPNPGKDFKLRCHAALPFTQAVATLKPDQVEKERIRTDDLRDAFNSPFWPHILISTSVGQEGLDFHVWCQKLLHWDLPHSPVDLEQREGRIQRYAGLSVRRALAAKLGRALPKDGSPWSHLAKTADEGSQNDPSGLMPWWIFRNASIERLHFALPMSEETERLHQLEKRRMLYRLALGQPDQDSLMDVLEGRLEVDDIRALALDFSPWRHRH